MNDRLANAQAKAQASGGTYDPLSGYTVGNEGNDHLRGGPDNDFLDGRGGNDHIWGGAGDDVIRPGSGRDHLWGGAGGDQYDLTDNPLATVREKANEGADTITTWIGRTLPDNVENMFCSYSNVMDGAPLVGNSLDNIIQTCPLGSTPIHGMEGNDTLIALSRYPVQMFGGAGNDTLVSDWGPMTGGLGADQFVFSKAVFAMTDPRSVIATIQDFNASEGDRLHIIHGTPYDPASMTVTFDPATQQLQLDLAATPGFVDYIVHLVGLSNFDLSWLSVGPMAINMFPF